MSQTFQLPSNTKCYLCDSFYSNNLQSFIVYKCFLCMKLTPYCMSCEFKLQKLFGKGNFFKCSHCDKLTNALDKIEISPSNNNSFYKTPTKPFMENNVPISSIRQNKSINFLIKKDEDEERKDNNNDRNDSPNEIMLSRFLDDFNKINLNNKRNNNITNNNFMNNTITVNNNRSINPFIISKDNNNNLSSVSNYNKINDFSLLTSKNHLNKRFCLNESLLTRKRDDSENENEFRGYNEYKERDNSKINDRNPSRGKFKNLISMKMSKVYSNDNNDKEIENNSFVINNNANNNGFGFNLLKNKRHERVKSNLFSNNPKRISFNLLKGKSTPHRLTNSSFEYF